ncbi:hypothetical protein AURDEDRAFT_115937 [Auricularia subglabra TFB-10046 SS5]|nr:hypothetical protein AURDEDRAFT_115937 [Auricularia subglabra TFB-10046 SS5]
MQSRLSTALFAALVFGSVFALASPVPEAKNELEVRGGNAQLLAILNLCIDLQVKIEAILVVIANLGGKGSCAGPVGQIVLLIQAFITAIIKIGVVVDLSDTVTINAIVSIIVSIILNIQAHITVFASIIVNVLAVVNLDLALQGCLINLNICISGIISIIAPLCLTLTGVLNLSLTLVIGLLGLL